MQTPFFLEGNTMEPNKDKKPEKRSVRFIEGKGFYIALVLSEHGAGSHARADDPRSGDAGANAGDDAGAGNSGRGRR